MIRGWVARQFVVHLALFFGAPGAGPCQATAQHPPSAERDGIVARWTIESEPTPTVTTGEKIDLPLSGRLILELSVEAPEGMEFLIPKVPSSQAWKERQRPGGWKTSGLPNGRVRRRITFRLSPWQAGELVLVLPPLKYRLGADSRDWEEMTWKPIPINVTTMVKDADPAAARDISGIEELPSPERRAGSWVVMAYGAIGAALLAVVWLASRLRRRPAPIQSAAERALEELERVEMDWRQGRADPAQFLGRVSQLLRRYLEKRFDIHAPRQTTSEFLVSARRASSLQPSQQDLLRHVLEQCDLAKFARYCPTADQCRLLAASVRALVNETWETKAGASTRQDAPASIG